MLSHIIELSEVSLAKFVPVPTTTSVALPLESIATAGLVAPIVFVGVKFLLDDDGRLVRFEPSSAGNVPPAVMLDAATDPQSALPSESATNTCPEVGALLLFFK